MKCYYPPGENACKRCWSGKQECIVEGRNPEVRQKSERSPLQWRLLLFEVSRARAIVRFAPYPFTIFTFQRMLDCVVSRAPSPSTSSSDDEECSFLPFSKREHLLAQMRQKDELIDSLLKQVRLSYTLLTNIGSLR